LVLSNKGKTIAGASGTLKSTDTVTLRSLSDQATEVRVASELTLGGQLAVLGAKLIEAKSKELFAEATTNLKERLGAVRQAETVPVEPGNLLARLKSLFQSLKSLLFRRWMVKPE
jgi:hypothetical protein